nr:PAS domain S-box protein [uncultured Carboxylicivirga sp.]
MIAKINILNLIDFDEINKLLEGFNQSTGFVTAILDLQGNVMSKSGWRQICTNFHRVNSETSLNCKVSDTILANEMGHDEKYHFYKCLNGLIDVAVPIIIKGEHIANLFSGQFFFEEPNRTFFEKHAEKYGFDKKEYLKELENVPVVSKEKVKVAMDFLLDMTRLISEITYQRLEQIELNEALKKSEERSRNALDYMLEGCQIIGFDWRYIYLNQSAEIHNQRPNHELLGQRYQDMWPGIENTIAFKRIKKVLETRVRDQFENEFLFPDGSKGYFDLSIQPVPEGVFILSIDITERKKAENALLESEEKYKLISNNSDDWIYWIDPEGNMKYVSPACERVTGYSPDEFISRPELIQEIVLEADKEKINQHYKYSHLDRTLHHIEYRIITKGGEVCWISHNCSPIFNNEGEFVGRRGTNQNITKRKQQEQQLFETEFRFNKLYENGPFGMVTADKEFRFKKVNPAFCEIMMYSETELQQFTFKDVSHPDDLPKDLFNLRKLINKEIEVYRTEKRYIRKDGEIIWGSLTLTATYDSDGLFLVYLGIIEDITQRKHIEESLKKSKKLLSETESMGKVGGWEFNVDTNEQIWTEEVFRIHEVDFDYNPNVNQGISYYTPESKPIIEQAVKNAIEFNEPFDLELEIITAKGNLRNVHTIGNADLENRRVYGFFQDITQRKQAEEALKNNEALLREVGRIAKIGGWEFSPVTGEASWTEEVARIHDLDPQAPIEVQKGINYYYGDSIDIIRQAVNEIVEYAKPYDLELEIMSAKGVKKWVRTIGNADIENGKVVRVHGSMQDITDRKHAEQALRESEGKFRKLIESIPLPVAYTNSLGEITFRNERFLQVLGYSYEEVPTVNEWYLKSYPDEIYRQQVIKRWELAVKKAKTTNTDIEPIEYNITCKNGMVRTMIVSGINIEDNLLITLIDVTDRIKAENKIKELNETLEQKVIDRTSQLVAANKEMEAFSYSVSHDLRAPLRHINGYVDLLNDRYLENLPEKARHYLNTITEASKQMGSLIDDLLQFSRTGRQELHKTNFDTNILVMEVLEKLKPDIKNRKIKWKIQKLPDSFGDYSLLKQVWINLLDNAVKYSRHKDNAEIAIEFRNEKENLVFYVRDNGVGFDMKYVHKLFGVFQRLHSQTEFEGTGIGLANVQRIILKHNGRVWTEAELNIGATFFFSLPKYKEEV